MPVSNHLTYCRSSDSTILESSVFNCYWYNISYSYNVTEYYSVIISDPGIHSKKLERFEPSRDLVFTEAKLNDYITNVTISALSLNTWKERIPVNTTEYRSTYHFSAYMNLILPYTFSLAFAFVFVSIGTWSFLQNEASAANGGFLQIMMSTTGRTKMEEQVIRHNVEGKGQRKELLDMKIRYEKLVDDKGMSMGRAAFGTVGETIPLQKGWKAA
jgi:hypothetical protein